MNSFTGVSLPEVLTNDEFIKLFKEYKNGNKSLENKLVEHNIKLVLEVIKKFRYHDEDELIMEGLIGLLNAIRTFDMSLNYKFGGYAYICISNSINAFLSKKDRLSTVSLEEKLSEDLTFADILVSDINIENDYLKNDIYTSMLKTLNLEELKIFKMYFIEELTMKKIAEILNMHPSTVSKRIDELTIKLKQTYKNYDRSKEEILFSKFKSLKEKKQEYLILYLSTGDYDIVGAKFNSNYKAVYKIINQSLKKLGCTKEELKSLLIKYNVIDKENVLHK